MRLIDLTGQRFSRLMVLRRDTDIPARGAVWIVACDCGNVTRVASNHLRRGMQKSCGCLRREGPPVRHGCARHRKHTAEYEIWKAMVKRCSSPRDSRWSSYGGRGIRVCDRWRSFEAFLADMGHRPPGRNGKAPLYSIDRVDNDGHYEPSNCRWATPQQQRANQRRKAS